MWFSKGKTGTFSGAIMNKMYIYTTYIYSIRQQKQKRAVYPIVILWICCSYPMVRVALCPAFGRYSLQGTEGKARESVVVQSIPRYGEGVRNKGQFGNGDEEETGVDSLVAEDVREGKLRVEPGGFGGMLDEGELIEVLPNIFGCTLVEECAIVGRNIYCIREIAVAECGSGLSYGQEFGGAGGMRAAKGLNRASVAIRRGRQAIQRAKLHDSGVEESRVFAVEYLFGQAMEMLLAGGSIEGQIAIEEACKDAIDISIQRGIRQIVGERGDSTCGVVANAGERAEGIEGVGECGAGISHGWLMLLNDETGGFVKVAGA